jgi:membrane carboxypeptidase/penicillin-binding protein PbpC
MNTAALTGARPVARAPEFAIAAHCFGGIDDHPATRERSRAAADRRSWTGKLYETIVAGNWNGAGASSEFLSEYLNRSSYGNRRLGPEAAARAYFGKTGARSHFERSNFPGRSAAAPTRFNPWRHPEEANRKYARSLGRLADLGVITADQQSLLAEPPKILRIDPPRFAPHFVDAVMSAKPRTARHGQDDTRS